MRVRKALVRVPLDPGTLSTVRIWPRVGSRRSQDTTLSEEKTRASVDVDRYAVSRATHRNPRAWETHQQAPTRSRRVPRDLSKTRCTRSESGTRRLRLETAREDSFGQTEMKRAVCLGSF